VRRASKRQKKRAQVDQQVGASKGKTVLSAGDAGTANQEAQKNILKRPNSE